MGWQKYISGYFMHMVSLLYMKIVKEWYNLEGGHLVGYEQHPTLYHCQYTMV